VLIVCPLPQATNITSTQVPATGNYPAGRFHSSATVQQDFFTSEAMNRHEETLTQHDMPFIYDLLMGTLNMKGPVNAPQQEDEVDEPTDDTNCMVSPEDLAGVSYTVVDHGQARAYHRAQRVSYLCNDVSLQCPLMRCCYHLGHLGSYYYMFDDCFHSEQA
jgi:hypothetical protein